MAMSKDRYWQMLTNETKKSVEILIYEQIGEDYWSEGIGAKRFAEELKAAGKVNEIVLRINSAGGSVFEGLAIYNVLKAHSAKKIVYIDGIAASIASVIAMAGDIRYMPANALIMVHDPTGFVLGDAEDMRKMAETLDKIKASIVGIYVDATGRGEEYIRAMMKEETWLSAEEAVNAGFADEVLEGVQIAASYDLSKFRNVPQYLLAFDAYMKKHENISHSEKGGVNMEIEITKAREETLKAEKQRVSELMAMGERFDCKKLADTAVTDGMTVDDFRGVVLETVFNAKKVEPISADIGMSMGEMQQYSILSAIRDIANNKPISGLIKEASDATAAKIGRQPKGFFIPQDMLGFKNTLVRTDATKGGYLVGTEVMAQDMIELLRNKALVARLGARVFSGLVGNVLIPRVTGGATAFWLPETGDVTPTSGTFGQVGLTPKRLIGSTAYSKELVAQTSVDVEGFVRDDLMRVLAIAKDLAAIAGLGAAGQPLGIMNTTGVKTVTFGAAATWAKVVEFETAIADENADIGSMAYLTTPATRGRWKSIVKFANTATVLWEKGTEASVGDVNGYPAYATKQVPTNRVIFGNWGDLILADWAGVDVVVDPYSLKRSGLIEVTITLWTDTAVRNAVSFAVSTDSGAQ